MQSLKNKASAQEPCDLCGGPLDLQAYSVVSVYDIVSDKPQSACKMVKLICGKCRQRVNIWLDFEGGKDV